MSRFVVITNTLAGRNRERLERVRKAIRRTGAESHEVRDLASIREAARALELGPGDLLAVNGGDGTAHGLLTALMDRGGPLPDIAIVPGGTTNMSANDLNGVTGLEASLASLGEQARRPPEARARVARRLLRVNVPERPPQYGFFLGAGAVLRGMKHFRNHVGARGFRGELAAGVSLLRGFTGMARGEGEWTRGNVTEIRLADGRDRHPDQILVVGTTLERLLLGFTPWWGRSPDPIHLTAVRQRPARLLRNARALLRGRPRPLMTVTNGYLSENVARFELSSNSGFALDGELFELGTEQTAMVEATPELRFLRLGA